MKRVLPLLVACALASPISADTSTPRGYERYTDTEPLTICKRASVAMTSETSNGCQTFTADDQSTKTILVRQLGSFTASDGSFYLIEAIRLDSTDTSTSGFARLSK